MARKRIKTELNEILQKIPEDKQAIAGRLADELVFMQQALTDLKRQIKEHGTIELYRNGAQECLRENPAVKSYNTMIQRYSGLFKQLCDMLPKDQQPEDTDALLDFVEDGYK